jgi:membrane fusion protein (multidrug efflux system)
VTLRRVYLLGIVLVGTLAACSRSAPGPAATQAPAPPLPEDVQGVAAVTAEPAAEAPESRLSLTGEFVSPVDSRLVPRTGGRVGRVLVDEGMSVRKEQPLLELETQYLEIDVRRAEAEVARAEAIARDAQRDFERKQGLFVKGSVPQAVHDRSQAAAEQAAAGLAAAQAALALARQRLADAVLLSPIDGVVAERLTDVGERLTEGTVAFVLKQTAPLRLRLRVPERYLAEVRVGREIEAVVDPYPGDTFQGRITLVGQTIETTTRTFLVEAEFPNRDRRLRPGMFARITTDLRPSAVGS